MRTQQQAAIADTRLQRESDDYESWHTAEPGKGYDAKAAEWRAKLRIENPTAPTRADDPEPDVERSSTD